MVKVRMQVNTCDLGKSSLTDEDESAKGYQDPAGPITELRDKLQI